MKINVLLSPLNVDELYFTGKTTVVIDVLRASTVITHALDNGAREIIPVGTIEFAMKVSGNAFGGQTLLGGERNTKIIEGFHLGNSPSDYTSETVEGKSVILFTTNGSKAIVKAKFSENLFILSFNNLSAVAELLSKKGNDVEILCAGSNGMFCIEDTVCAGKLIDEMLNNDNGIELTDAAKASRVLYESFDSDIKKMLASCEHGKKLIENGFESDIDECSQINSHPVVPAFDSLVLKLWTPEFEEENR